VVWEKWTLVDSDSVNVRGSCSDLDGQHRILEGGAIWVKKWDLKRGHSFGSELNVLSHRSSSENELSQFHCLTNGHWTQRIVIGSEFGKEGRSQNLDEI